MLRLFAGAYRANAVYSDCSKEIRKATKDIGALHWTSTPHRPQSNSQMERHVRILADCVRGILVHSGFPHNLWPSFFCSALNFSEANGVSPYEKAHGGIKYPSLKVPFGMLVYFRPMDLGTKSKFVPRLHTVAFVGWHIQPGMKATSDYFIIAVEDFHRKARGEITLFPVHRVREVRVLGNPHFPLEDYAWSREPDPNTRIHQGADEEVPYIMTGDDDDSDAEDAEMSDFTKLADVLSGSHTCTARLPGLRTQSSSPRRPRTANRPLKGKAQAPLR